MRTLFAEHNVDFVEAKTWTTDGIFRETPAKVRRRIAAGCSVVDMECSALLAWAEFRKINVYPFFYTADYVDTDNGWNQRKQERSQAAGVLTVFELALDLARAI